MAVIFMKKSTQKTAMALFIVFIFGFSSIAFFVTSFGGQAQTQHQFTPLSSPVVDGPLDPVYKGTYIGASYTWLEYYYTVPNQDFVSFLDSLPGTFTSPNGQPQMIVQKLNDQYLNYSSYLIITSPAGEDKFSEEDPNKVFDSLCRLLAFKPLECGFSVPNTSEENAADNSTQQ